MGRIATPGPKLVLVNQWHCLPLFVLVARRSNHQLDGFSIVAVGVHSGVFALVVATGNWLFMSFECGVEVSSIYARHSYLSHSRHRLPEPEDTTALIINGPAPHVFRLGFSHRSTKQTTVNSFTHREDPTSRELPCRMICPISIPTTLRSTAQLSCGTTIRAGRMQYVRSLIMRGWSSTTAYVLPLRRGRF